MCCGMNRKPVVSATRPVLPAVKAGAGDVLLEYIGHTALTMIGPVTGTRYRFEKPGARLSVNARDGQAMVAVPVVRLVV